MGQGSGGLSHTVILFAVDVLQKARQKVGEPEGCAAEPLQLVFDAELNVARQQQLVRLFQQAVSVTYRGLLADYLLCPEIGENIVTISLE